MASVGFGRTAGDQVKEKTMKALRGFLRPEFINRVDEIIIFNKLTEENDDGEVIIASRRRSYKKVVNIQDGQYGFEED